MLRRTVRFYFTNLTPHPMALNVNIGDNYEPTGSGQGYGYTNMQDLTGGKKKRGKGYGLGCLGIFAVLGLIIGLIVAWFAGLNSVFFPNSLKGNYMDMAYIPKSGYVWIVTDGSFSYIQETKSPGKHSVGREGLWCKTWNYIYDPVNGKVINKFKVPFDELPPPMKVFVEKNEVWVVTNYGSEAKVQVNKYNPETGEEISNTEKFISEHQELSAGLSEMAAFDDPVHLRFKTRDGQEFIYLPSNDKLYNGWAEFNKTKDEGTGIKSDFTLSRDGNSSDRMKVFRVTGPANKIKEDYSSYDLDKKEFSAFEEKLTIERMAKNRIFLDPLMLAKNNDYCLIIHQSQMGKEADRMLTLVNKDGKEVWTVPQKELFKHTKVDKDDPFSTTFFMKSKFKGYLEKDIVIFSLQGEGVQAFDLGTGKKKWEVEL